MLIRRAKPEEYKIMASHILLAMNGLFFELIGERSVDKATQLLQNLVREKNNQYSYENCWVGVSEGAIVVTALVYDGGRLEELRRPVADSVNSMFGREFNPENETQSGEYYIDSVGVDPMHQGSGYGSKIFGFLIEEYVHKNKQTLGLLVDKDNPNAKKLYLKLGFEEVGEKVLAGKMMEHLQFKKGTCSGD